ncbi:MAG: hypothetical protein ACR2GH_18055 [Pseudonocardia sp.]
MRELLASVPRYGADSQQRADYQVRKAEVLDFLAAANPSQAAQAMALAARARYEARAIALDY